MTRRHVVLVAAIALGGALLAGCTPAFGPGGAGFGGASAAPVEVIVAGDASRVAKIADAYRDATGEPISLVSSGSGSGDSVTWDASEPSDIQIGRQFWCVVADQAWFDVNKVSMPNSTADLQNPGWAPLLTIEDPLTSAASARWLAGLPDVPAFLTEVSAAGAHLGTGAGSARLRIDSALEPWRTVNNLQTSSDWITLQGTCVEGALRVSAAGEGGQAFVDYVQSPAGQAAMVEAGEAYPLDPMAPLPDAVQAVAPAPATGLAATQNEAAVAAAWRAASGM